MYKREIKEAFSKLHASDQLVMEVLDMKQVTKRDRSIGRIVGRVAACAATVALVIGMVALMWPREEKTGHQLDKPTSGMTAAPTLPTDVPPETLPQKFFAAPGIAKLYSYTQQSVPAEELEKYEVTDGVSKYQPVWMEYTNAREIKLTICFPEDYYKDEKISFKVVAPHGYYMGVHGEAVIIENGSTSSWRPNDDVKNMKETLNPGAFYVYLLIYAGERPVGFGLMEMSCLTTPAGPYAVTLRAFRTICYPLVDGEFQNVTEEYLWEQIAEYEKIMHEEYLEHLPDMLEKLNKEHEARVN